MTPVLYRIWPCLQQPVESQAHLSCAPLEVSMFRRVHVFSKTQVLASLIATILCIAPASGQVTFSQTAINSGDTTSASIVAGDFDNDGTLDLVTVNTATLSFYKGLGGGSYATPATQPAPKYLNEMFAADFNRDGKLDLAVATSPYQPG